jgi:hypothetical protein
LSDCQFDDNDIGKLSAINPALEMPYTSNNGYENFGLSVLKKKWLD